ncbi:PD40 domain-containing protein [bacterium]|nr:PD40 domain-containing protein [bacterium]
MKNQKGHRMALISLVIFVLVVLSPMVYGKEGSLFVRYPSLNPDGSKIAFSYQGDIWIVPSSGGRAVRLTLHEAYESYPRWSPDGQRIAFSSNRYGNNDLFLIPSGGGTPQRLTHHSTGDQLSDWTSNKNLLFTTRRTFQQVEWEPEIHSVSVEGGTPVRVLDALGSNPTLSPDGRFIAFVRGSCRITREEYQGPANRNIWLYDIEEEEYIQITDYKGQDYLPKWGDSQTLYYISAASGKYNIYRLSMDKEGKIVGEPEPLTNFKDDGVRYYDVSERGNLLVMERKIDLYTLNTNRGELHKVDIQLGADYRYYPVEYKTFTKNVRDYAVSPEGKYSALIIRGEVFVKENDKEYKRTVNLSKHSYRDMNSTWIDEKKLIFASDRKGQYDLYLVQSAEEDEPDIFESLKHQTIRLTETKENETHPLVSPDGKKITFLRDGSRLIVADISAEGKIIDETTLLKGWAEPGHVTWSPDSQWLAYSLDDLNFNSEIYIHAADNSKGPVNVSMHPRGDVYPVWSRDGSKLAFISARNNRNNDIWFAWLREEDWEKTQRDWKEEKEEKEEKEKKKEKEKVKPLEIDLKNIHERLEQVTSLPGNESNLEISKDGKTFYFVARSNTSDGRDLYSIKWDGTETQALTKGGQNPYAVTLGPQGKHLYLLRKGRLARIETQSKKMESLPFKAKMSLNHPQEREQIFEEAWRTLKKRFYDPDFHGEDWLALKKKYKGWTMKASTNKDFRDMFNIMLGKLNSSHMGLYGPDRSETQKETTGLLGVEIVPEEKGMRVKRVIPESPASREKSRLYKGDLIVSVEGEKVNQEVNFYSRLTNTDSQKVILEVEGKKGERREVVIRPTSNLRSELYNEWVDERRRLTEKYSDGRLGYLHIQGMNMRSFERFERELTAVGEKKEGIVIDVRFNGGGWTTDYLMAVLNVDQHSYTIPRGAAEDLEKEHKKFRDYYPFAERLPFYPWTKPSIAICNANSYSNAEIFSHAYKTLEIGTLVGTPTFGAVISTGGKGLMDGSYVRVPFRAWYVKATDKNMEHGPAVPDIIVHNDPDSKAEGKDEQLKRAVEKLLEKIESQKN